jgi:hypothetical protein
MKHSHGSKSKSTADDSNANSSSVTSTAGSSRCRSSRTIAGGRAAARRVTCPLRWYARGGAPCIRARGRSTVAGDRLLSTTLRLKRSKCFFIVFPGRTTSNWHGFYIKSGEEGHVVSWYGHRDARRVQETASRCAGGRRGGTGNL